MRANQSHETIPPYPFGAYEDGINILMLGDVVGPSGVKAVESLLPTLRQAWHVDFVSANAENADGLGVTPDSARRLLAAGVDVLTGGNHTFRNHKYRDFLLKEHRALRPMNIAAPTAPGRGYGVYSTGKGKIGVINLSGKTFMDAFDNPFAAVELALADMGRSMPIVVDFHAEATGEKKALLYHLEGRVSLVVGTHTHVQTADETIVGQTGYISDLGMCGVQNSIIGMNPEPIVSHYRTGLPPAFIPARGKAAVQGVLARINPHTGACTGIKRINISEIQEATG